MKRDAVDTNTVKWYSVWCVLLAVMTLHISTCIWFALACTGVQVGVPCWCALESWFGGIGYFYGASVLQSTQVHIGARCGYARLGYIIMP